MIYTLEGLDCPNCAAKIERELKKAEGLSGVSVNFTTKTIDIPQALEDEVAKKLQRLDPHIKLVKGNNLHNHVHDHDEHEPGEFKQRLIRILLSVALLFTGVVFSKQLHGNLEFIEYGIFFIAYLLVGKEVVITALRNLIQGQVFDENFLMTIATIGAFAIHQLPEAVGVMLFYSIGEYFQALAVNRSRRSISALMDIRPDYANLKIDNVINKVSPEDVNIGDIIVVKPGEKVPLDGVVLKGESFLDTSALTGESVPRKVSIDDKVLAGMVNTQGLLEIRVEKSFGESSVSKILDLVQNASGRKAQTEQFLTKFARYYTPGVVFASLAIAVLPPLLTGASFSIWVYRALTMLVISCPCALVVSIPLGYFGGIGGASRRGILIKGANFLEALTDVDTIIFDKTGTLTKGVFKVANINTANGFTKEDIIKMAAYAEFHSSHPIAKSVLEAYGSDVRSQLIQDYQEIAGHGVQVKVEDKVILAGNRQLMDKNRIDVHGDEAHGTVVYVAVNGIYAGNIGIADEIRGDALEAIEKLKALGITNTVMLTGDGETAAKKVADELGISKYYAGLLPQDKVEKLEYIQGLNNPNRSKVVFVGDGINDAPVLTLADVGIAMGGLGSDAAIEAADVVIMEDMPSKIADAIKIARHTRKIVVQNIVLALGIKAAFLALGAVGVASMWEAVFADVGVALLAILNSTRTLMRKGF